MEQNPVESGSFRELVHSFLPSNETWNSINVFIRKFMILCLIYLLMVGVWVVGINESIPWRVNSLVDVKEQGMFSAEAAWSHIKAISSTSHPYNSLANDHVAQYLVATLKALKQESLVVANRSIEIDSSDTINLVQEYDSSGTWFESKNILVKIKGESSKALLISSHFDSVSGGPGVTDAAISIASMIETIRSLIYNKPLKYSLIFSFTNGEEMYLQGSSAFMHHPWFKQVVSFINLEGTGAASNGTRNALFRTNSFHLTRALKVPFPHASVLLNDLVSFIKSETDFRRYALKAPGLDFAFYSNRYFYHTPRDDACHASILSVQQMGSNLVSSVLELANSSAIEKAYNSYSPLKNPQERIQSAQFVFHDLLGRFLIVNSHSLFLALLWSMALSVPIVSVMFLGYSYLKSASYLQFKRFVMIPFLHATVKIVLSVIFSIAFTALFSLMKTAINPFSSYGHFEPNMVGIVVSVLLGYAVAQLVTPHLNKFVGYFTNYEALSPDFESDIEPSIHSGLLVFWYLQVLGCLFLAHNGIHSGYFILYWAVFYFVSIAFKLVFDSVHLLVVDELLSVGNSRMFPMLLSVAHKHQLKLLLISSSIFPMFLMLDLYRMISSALPSLIGENLPELVHDLAVAVLVLIATINCLLLLQSMDSKILVSVLSVAWFAIWVYCASRFPFSDLKPLQVSFKHEWTSYNSSLVNFTSDKPSLLKRQLALLFDEPIECTEKSCLIQGNQSLAAWPTLDFTVKTVKGRLQLVGTFESEQSRVCSLSLIGSVGNSTINFDLKSNGNWTWFNHSPSVTRATLMRRLSSVQTDFVVETDALDSLELRCYYQEEFDFYYKKLQQLPLWITTTGTRYGAVEKVVTSVVVRNQ